MLVYFDPTLGIECILAVIRQIRPAADPVGEPGPAAAEAPRARDRAVTPRATAAQPAETGDEPDAVAWHTLEPDAVLRACASDPATGLSRAVAAQRLERYGPNALPPIPEPSRFEMLARQVATWPVALLAASAVISVATGGLLEAIAIAGVVATNALIGYGTERQAERTIRSLSAPSWHSAQVKRDGVCREIEAASVVPGDILDLSPGCVVAADARVLQAHELSVDESALTGESVPVLKSPGALPDRRAPLGDRVNMLFRGTVVTGGSGLAVAVATGEGTEISRVQRLTTGAEAPETPMQRQLGQLGQQLALLSGVVCGGVFLIGLLRGYGMVQMLRHSISLAVAAVPEGLPAMATTTLALGIRSMQQHKILVRKLGAIETLGAVDVLCLDKTGTLTMNRMTVAEVHTAMESFRADQDRLVPVRDDLDPQAHETLRRVFLVGALCNEAEVNDHAGGGQTGGGVSLIGSSTETALLRAAQSVGLDIDGLRRAHPRTQITFRGESRKFMTTRHDLDGNGRSLIAVKGSPDEVLARCTHMLKGVEPVPLSDQDRAMIEAVNAGMAGRSLRVLGMAFREVEGPGNGADDDDLTWLGLVAMADPIREHMPELMRVFHRAGIDTIMITGDQTATARAIAEQLDLGGGGPVTIIDSARLESNGYGENGAAANGRAPNHPSGNGNDGIVEEAAHAHVFARVSPAHKLRIVQVLQRGGRVVAMVGDGINDGPALKVADVGVAMGRGGTEVARDVADIVLEDDDIRTMTEALGRGRAIYGNSRKAIRYLLSTNVSEILLVAGAVGAGLGQPLSPIQLLWINLITDVFPALALALEAPEADVLRQPPRDPHAPIVSGRDFRQLGVESAILCAGPLAAYAAAVARYGSGPRAGSIAFNSLVIAQLLHALTSRSERHGALSGPAMPPNRYLQVALAGSFAAQALISLVPGLGGGTILSSLFDLAITGLAGVLPFAANEAIRARRAALPEPAAAEPLGLPPAEPVSGTPVLPPRS